MNILNKIDILLEAKFINEVVEKLESFEDIKKLCPKTTSTDIEIFRGIRIKDAPLNIKYGKENIRKDRKPKDTSIFFHDLINKGFKAAFGVPVRSECVFCTANKGLADWYGKACKIYPSNDFTVYWSPYITDLFGLRHTKLSLSSDNLKALAAIYCLIYNHTERNPDFSYKFSAESMKKLNILEWVLNSFEEDMNKLEEYQKSSDAFSLAEKILKLYPECSTNFVKTFYKKGNTIQDLQNAASTGHELMITGSFYCFERM